MIKESVEEVWNTFWKDIVCPNGELDVEQVKKELYDFYVVMESVPKVYCHVTGGKIGKILTDPDVVIAAANDKFEEDLKFYLEDEAKFLP